MHVTHVNRIEWFMRFMWVEGLVEDGMLRDVQERAKKKFIYRCCRCQCPSLCDWFSIGYTELLIYIVVMVHGTPINRSKERRDWEVPLIQGHVCPLFKRNSNNFILICCWNQTSFMQIMLTGRMNLILEELYEAWLCEVSRVFAFFTAREESDLDLWFIHDVPCACPDIFPLTTRPVPSNRTPYEYLILGAGI